MTHIDSNCLSRESLEDIPMPCTDQSSKFGDDNYKPPYRTVLINSLALGKHNFSSNPSHVESLPDVKNARSVDEKTCFWNES